MICFKRRLVVYSSKSKPCPTAADACLSATLVGRFLKPREEKPAAIAPDETKINSCPASCKRANCRVISFTLARDRLPSAFVNDEVPTLNTIRFAFISFSFTARLSYYTMIYGK